MLDMHGRRQGDWTESRIELLRKLWTDGLSCSRIAAQIGNVTRNAVIGKVSRLGLNVQYPRRRPKSPRWTSPRVPKAPKAQLLTRQQKAERQALRRPQANREPTPVRKVVTQPSPFLGIALLDLERGHCRYPRGEGTAVLFCGQPATHDSYCEYCYGITHNKPHAPTPPNNWVQLSPKLRRAA